MDNLIDENGKEIYGLIQESYAPIGLHVDGGFELKNQIFKQSLIPLSSVGSTVIFKNRFYGGSTNFTKDPEELKKKILNTVKTKDPLSILIYTETNLSIKKYIKNIYNMRI